MPSYERKVIHTALYVNKKIKTYSDGRATSTYRDRAIEIILKAPILCESGLFLLFHQNGPGFAGNKRWKFRLRDFDIKLRKWY